MVKMPISWGISQAIAVGALAVLITLLIGRLHAYSMFNLVPIFILPVAIGISSNRTTKERIVMSVLLVVISVVCVSLTAEWAALF